MTAQIIALLLLGFVCAGAGLLGGWSLFRKHYHGEERCRECSQIWHHGFSRGRMEQHFRDLERQGGVDLASVGDMLDAHEQKISKLKRQLDELGQ